MPVAISSRDYPNIPGNHAAIIRRWRQRGAQPVDGGDELHARWKRYRNLSIRGRVHLTQVAVNDPGYIFCPRGDVIRHVYYDRQIETGCFSGCRPAKTHQH